MNLFCSRILLIILLLPVYVTAKEYPIDNTEAGDVSTPTEKQEREQKEMPESNKKTISAEELQERFDTAKRMNEGNQTDVRRVGEPNGSTMDRGLPPTGSHEKSSHSSSKQRNEYREPKGAMKN